MKRASLAVFFCVVGCVAQARTSSPAAEPPAMMLGSFSDDYGAQYTI